MKLLTFAIPCYNSEAYMEKCIESLLPGGDDVEILIVDDGSHDRTAEIADAYEKKYPGIIRAIHQENGGHGEAVNTGIRNATGLYFKVVDSDDWVDLDAYRKILDKLREISGGDRVLDMFIANYVYEKEGVKLSFRSCIKEVSASEMAQEVCRDIGSGGGHYYKAGGFIPMDLLIDSYNVYCKEKDVTPRFQYSRRCKARCRMPNERRRPGYI